jgi:hypothetical protein
MAMRNITINRLAIALLGTVSLSTGCTTFDYEKHGARSPDQHFGTQPGYHVLSEHFAIEVSSKLAKIYYLDEATRGQVQIGTLSIYWFDRSNYGPRARETYYAISDDGRQLLFFDEPGVREGKATDWTIRPNLYVIDAVDGRRKLLFADVHRHSTNCVVLPRNYVRFRKADDADYVAYSTDGQEVSLEARRKALWDRGDKDKICGPL